MQWHLGNPVKNQYKFHFEKIFLSLPKVSNILLAIGEIDCRLDSGILKHHNKTQGSDIKEIATATINNCLDYIEKTNMARGHTITIQGVPCPVEDLGTRSNAEMADLASLIELFNSLLMDSCKTRGFGFLDLYKLTNRGDGFSNQLWHLDSIHLTSDAMLEAWSRHHHSPGPRNP